MRIYKQNTHTFVSCTFTLTLLDQLVLFVSACCREIAECPLVAKLCNVNARNTAEGCFSGLSFILFILIYPQL